MKMGMSVLAGMASVLATSAFAIETGFVAGNSYTSTVYRGTVSVDCQAPNHHQMITYSCEQDKLSPSISSFFQTAPGTDADHVTLTSTWADGDVVTKECDFDPASGKSTDRFNLWIHTLLQKNLLTHGQNKIHYVLSKMNVKQSEGDFVAEVKSAPDQDCAPAFMTEFGGASCDDQIWMCRRYFDDYARCKASK